MAKLLSPQDLQVHINKLISAKKQIHDFAVDLTIKSVFTINSAGRLDFGGSEFQPSSLEPLSPVKHQSGDEYGWWDLVAGIYIIRFNEQLSLDDRQLAFLEPHPRLLETGCFHTGLILKNLDKDFQVPLSVPQSDVHIKENARISRLIVLEMDK